MSYNMLDMELDYEDQIKYFESEVKRLKAKCSCKRFYKDACGNCRKHFEILRRQSNG